MKKLFYHLFSFTNLVKSISLFTLIFLFYLATGQSQTSNQLSWQSRVDPGNPYPSNFLYYENLNQPNTGSRWENLQTVIIDRTGGNSSFAPVKLNIDQVRNGSATSPVVPPTVAPWVNGNAGASNAHYAEGYSIPYRVVIENLVGTGARSVDIEWDIRQSNSSAIDFITNFDFIDYPAGSHVSNFGHDKEVLNPLLESGTYTSGSSITILAPNFAGAPAAVTTYYNAVMATSNTSGPANQISVWNANITGMSYISQGSLTAAASSTRLRIFFTNTASTVILSWGGHIAKGDGVWGAGNSASAVSGSPYHTRLIEWDEDGTGPISPTSIGNQDRSLSADAVQDPPKCNLTGNVAIQCNSVNTYSSGVVASDLSAGVTFEWSLVNNTSGAGFNGTPTVSSASVNSGTGCGTGYTVRYRLLKNGLEISQCNLPVVVSDGQAPVITCPAAPTSPINCPATPSFGTATATDNCGTPGITFSDVTTPGTCAGNYTVTRKWTATDACGNTATCSQSVVVRDITSPTITCPAAPTSPINCPATPVFGTATATDACDATVDITFSDVDVAGTCAGTYTRTRKWTARDDCGNTATCSQSVVVRDITPPTITCPAAPTSPISCPATPVFGTATAVDGCDANVDVTFSDSDAPGTCAGTYTRTRKWTATDDCGNTATCSQSVVVRDITPPTITCPAAPTSPINCPATPVFGTATAVDGCDANVDVTFSDSDAPGTCAGSYTRTRKWTATDDCGNTATCSQSVVVRDITPPTITCPAAPTSPINCPATPVFGTATATDGCDLNVSVTFTDSDAPGTCAGSYTRTRKWTATDDCGNTSTCSQSVVVRDITPPVLTCLPNTTVECGNPTSTEALGSATAIDACSTPTVTASDVTTSVGCQTVITRTWTATDACGNTATCVQRILVIDRTPPVICISSGNVIATDNCSSSNDIALYFSNGVWTAIDGSGNMATTSSPAACPVGGRMNTSNQPQQDNEVVADKTKEENATQINKKGIEVGQLSVQAFPNPFNDRVKFVITSPVADNGNLEVFNMTGQKIKTVYTGFIAAGTQTFELSLPTQQVANLVYVLRIGDKKMTGKILQINR